MVFLGLKLNNYNLKATAITKIFSKHKQLILYKNKYIYITTFQFQTRLMGLPNQNNGFQALLYWTYAWIVVLAVFILNKSVLHYLFVLLLWVSVSTGLW